MKRMKYAFKKANALVILGYSVVLGNVLWALTMLISSPHVITAVALLLTMVIAGLLGWFLVWTLSYNMDRDLTREDEEDKVEA